MDLSELKNTTNPIDSFLVTEIISKRDRIDKLYSQL